MVEVEDRKLGRNYKEFIRGREVRFQRGDTVITVRAGLLRNDTS